MMTKGNPRFKPGDIVTVRSWDDMASEYEKYSDANTIYCPCEYGANKPYCSFQYDKKYLCGTQVEIAEALWLDLYSVYAYYVAGQGTRYFVETMFECGMSEIDTGSPEELFDYLMKGEGES